jgi:cell division septal protein FtsQ
MRRSEPNPKWSKIGGMPPDWKRRSAQAARTSQRGKQRIRSRFWQKFRAVTTILLAAGVFGVSIAAILTSPALNVKRVEVSGIAPLAPEETLIVQKMAQVAPRTNLFRAPAGKIARELIQQPWVGEVSVSRHLPDTLEIRLTPRIPAAALETADGRRWEVDARGQVLRADRAVLRLPVIYMATLASAQPGQRVEHPALASALDIVARGSGANLLPLTKIEIDQNEELCLNMQGDVLIRLGHTDELNGKLELVRRIYEQDRAIGEKVAAMDLRCPNAFACTPRKAVANSPAFSQKSALSQSNPDSTGASPGSPRREGEPAGGR